MKKYKDFKDLTFTDDFMFWSTMQNETICTNILNLILEKEIGKIESIRYQEVIENLKAKGIRLDVSVTTKDGSLYDIEMQTTDERNIPKRMRYYQAAMDGGSLNEGIDYDKLPNIVIVFICTFDLLKGNLPVYSLRYVPRENKDIEFQDGVTKIIVNSRAFSKAQNADLKDFLEYVNGTKNDNKLVKMIEEEIKKVKQNEELREVYMQYYSLPLMDERRAGRKEGIAIGEKRGEARGITLGRQEGAYQKAVETARNSKLIGLSTQQISKITGLSIKEIEEL